jgi:diguanylate cyclase (GGDEF)-like protein/PAS domain S-box-containing protein
MNRTYHLGHILLISLLAAALYASSLYSYLLFHTLVEVFTVIVMSSIFLLAWNTRQWMEENYFLFIGIVFLFVAFIELIHTLAYKGMDIFHGYGPNLPTQLWILARYMLSISLLVAPVWLRRRLPVRTALAIYSGVTLVSLASVFNGNFPACYVEGTGLTNFKIVSEYIIILLMTGAVIPLLRNRTRFEPRVLQAIFAFLALSIGSEFAFTAYLGVYDAANMAGHFLMLFSFFFLYSALIRTGLQHPFDLVFRDLKQKETALKRSEAGLQRLFDISPFPVVITARSDSRFLKVNQAALDLFELTPETLQQYKGIDFYVNPEERARLMEQLRQDGRVQNVPLELKSVSGKRIWCLTNGVPIELDGEEGLLIAMADITELRRTQEELRFLSAHDALTGAYNRNYFEAEMERLQKGRRFPVGIVMLDLDELKQINDTYGHVQGDKQLQTVARLIKNILRAEEVFARIGGDEFAILLPHAEASAAKQVVSRIKNQLEQHSSENGNLPVKVSIGIGVANEKEGLHEALRRADANMYDDKSVRKGTTKPLGRN